MMALAYVPVFQQSEHNRWLVELEIGGLICQRREIRAATLPELLAGILDAYSEMATPEMLEAQGILAGPAFGNPQIKQNAEEDLRAARKEQMARVRAAKAAKHQNDEIAKAAREQGLIA